MAKKSGLDVAGDLAHLAKAAYDIIKAFLRGGWGAAALQLLKHYWPQILAVALVLLLLPVILFCCLPMMLFGYGSSTDTEIASMTAQADAVSGYYDRYASYIDEWAETIQSTVTDKGGADTETDRTTHETGEAELIEYEIVFSGSKIQKNWFIALHAVTVGNDLQAATEANVRAFAGNCLSYTVKPVDENTESLTDNTEASDDERKPTKMLLDIHYRTPDEIMTACAFTASDENWARLMHETLEGKGPSASTADLP